MEAFEQFVAVAMQSEGLVVSSAVKFPVTRQTRKATKEEQTHGYEVDLVGASANRLVLATVKSFFGSKGVQARDVRGESGSAGGYRLLNDVDLRDAVVKEAAERFGYRLNQVSMRFYVGKWRRTRVESDERAVREWCATQFVGAGPIEVHDVDGVVAKVIEVSQSRTYIDNPVIVAMKVLREAGRLVESYPRTGVTP